MGVSILNMFFFWIGNMIKHQILGYLFSEQWGLGSRRVAGKVFIEVSHWFKIWIPPNHQNRPADSHCRQWTTGTTTATAATTIKLFGYQEPRSFWGCKIRWKASNFSYRGRMRRLGLVAEHLHLVHGQWTNDSSEQAASSFYTCFFFLFFFLFDDLCHQCSSALAVGKLISGMRWRTRF